VRIVVIKVGKRRKADNRYPLDAPDHPSLPNFVQYLNDYVDHFQIRGQINLTTKVTKLNLNPDKNSAYRHIATILDIPSNTQHTLYAQKVIVTTGLHVLPNIPSIEGLTTNPTPSTPKWIHSSSYAAREQLKGKKVLVLGCGETGMDLGYESVLAPAEKVWMGVRSGFLSFPKVLNNFRVLGATFDGALPIDGLITNLFETAYVPPPTSFDES
jgi:dimethylaniline monooxygenase (N-oxide forming)